MLSLVFFFFKQKTAYEMRISDWSSDVCSSDLDNGMNSKMNAALVVQGDTKSTIAAYDDALLSQALLFASALQTAKVIEMPICESQKLWLTFHRGAGGVLEGRQALQESIAQMQAIARRTGLEEVLEGCLG